MVRLRVMVVEDDDFTRSTVVSALQIQGVDVVGQTGSIGPAMKLAQELKPDAVAHSPACVTMNFDVRKADCKSRGRPHASFKISAAFFSVLDLLIDENLELTTSDLSQINAK